MKKAAPKGAAFPVDKCLRKEYAEPIDKKEASL